MRTIVELPSNLSLPRYNGRSIVNLANSILKALGVPVKGCCLCKELDSKILTEKILLVLLDGLCLDVVKKICSEDDYLSKALKSIDEITTVFPTTTPTALTSLSTGLAPGQHGVLGCVMYFRELGLLVNTLNLSPMSRPDERDGLLKLGVDVSQLFYIDSTIFEELSYSGIRSLVLIPKGLKNGISRLIYKGAEIQEYASFQEAIVEAVQFLNSLDRGLAYVYSPQPDEVAHRRHVESEHYYETVRELLYSTVKIVSKNVYAPITLIITSDHGLVDSQERDLIDMMKFRKLLEILEVPPFGESRASFLKVNKEFMESIESIEDIQLIKNLGFTVLSKQDIIEMGLLGPEVRKEITWRLGDYVLLSTGSRYLRYSYNLQEKEREPLKAVHGSLLPEEVNIPLIITNF